MIQTLDFYFITRADEQELKKIKDCLSSDMDNEIIVGRHKLNFDHTNQVVVVDRVSDDVPFAAKIAKARMPYEVLERVLEGDFDEMTGFELL